MSAISDGSTNKTPSPPTPKFLWHNILHAYGLSASGITSPLLSSIIGKSLPIPCIFENFNPFKSTIVSTYFKCGGMLCFAYKSSKVSLSRTSEHLPSVTNTSEVKGLEL